MVIGTSIPLEMVIGTSFPLEMVIGTSVVTKKGLIQIPYQMGFKSIWVPIWRSFVISLHSIFHALYVYYCKLWPDIKQLSHRKVNVIVV